MGLPFLILGSFLFYQATRLSMRSLDGGPGPGVLPAGLGILMVLFSLWALVRHRLERVQFGSLARIGIMVGGVAAFNFILERVGFLVATALLMVALMVAFNERHRVPLAALGVVGAVLGYVLFYQVLKVQLPPDPWGLWR